MNCLPWKITSSSFWEISCLKPIQLCQKYQCRESLEVSKLSSNIFGLIDNWCSVSFPLPEYSPQESFPMPLFTQNRNHSAKIILWISEAFPHLFPWRACTYWKSKCLLRKKTLSWPNSANQIMEWEPWHWKIATALISPWMIQSLNLNYHYTSNGLLRHRMQNIIHYPRANPPLTAIILIDYYWQVLLQHVNCVVGPPDVTFTLKVYKEIVMSDCLPVLGSLVMKLKNLRPAMKVTSHFDETQYELESSTHEILSMWPIWWELP